MGRRLADLVELAAGKTAQPCRWPDEARAENVHEKRP
jgi:hypothetical protein